MLLYVLKNTLNWVFENYEIEDTSSGCEIEN